MEPSHTEFQDMHHDGYEATGLQQAEPRGRFFSPGVAVWTVLACIAAGYLGMLAVKPGAIAAYFPSLAPAGSQEGNEGQRATAANEAQAIRDGLSQVQLDVAKIKAELNERGEHDKALETRLSVLEDVKRGTGVASTAAPDQPANIATPSPGAAALKAPITEAAASAAGIPITALAPAATPAATAAAKAAAKKAAAAAKAAVQAAVPATAVAPAAAAAIAPAAAAAIAPTAAAPIAPTAVAPIAKAAANAAAVIAPPVVNPDAVPGTPGVKLINAPLSASSAASRAAPVAVAPAATAPPAPAVPANAAEAIAPKLETGSVQNLGAGSLPPVAGAKPVGVYIGSGPSVDSLRQSWSLLADRNADSLKNLEPRYTTGIDANGLNYGLVAGPVKSAADAQKICRDLAAKAVTCRVGDFAGEAL